MALQAGEYKVNGLVRTSTGALSVTVYDALNAATYYWTEGFLVDADGRLVITEA